MGRLCLINLKQKFGDFSKNSYITAVKVFKPWARGGRQNAPLAELCKHIGLDIKKSTTSSERVCNVCAKKVQNAVEPYELTASALNQDQHIGQQLSPSYTASDGSERFKRLLHTSVSFPERSPQPKKGRKKNGSARKTLSFVQAEVKENEENILEGEGPRGNFPLAEIRLNIDDLLGKRATEHKVVVVNPNGCVENYCSFAEYKTKSMIINLCRKYWKIVANLTFQHPHAREELCEPLRKAVSGEFLQKSSPEDLAAQSKKILVHEAEVWCPLWMCCVKGACNVSNSREENVKETNSIALSTAVAANCRNQKNVSSFLSHYITVIGAILE